MEEHKFTLEELARYNGQNSSPAYIAYKGKVYDVSDSFLWKHGKHQGRHRAGKDCTDELPEAPHNSDLLDRFPIVGTLD